MIEITTIIILGTLLILSVFSNINLLRKVEKYEDISVDQQKLLKIQAEYTTGISTIIAEMNENLNDPRLVEAFSSDDEIGWFFKDIKQIQETLIQYNRQLYMYDQEKKEERE